MALNHQGTIPIETERLRLRRLRAHDAPAMFNNWARDPEVAQYVSWKEHADVEVSRAVIQKSVDSYACDYFYEWGIELKEGGVLVGTIGLPRLERDMTTAEVGYCIGKQYWNRGVVTEALAAVLDFCFAQVGFEHVTALHLAGNNASGRVMQKCGMRHTGREEVTFPQKDDAAVMCEVYVIDRADWETTEKK